MTDIKAIIFTSSIFGGHEIMTVNLIRKSSLKMKCSVYVPSKNHQLIKYLKSEKIDFKTHDVNHMPLELFHTYFNFFHIAKCYKFLKGIRDEYDEVIVVQGDIELGSVFLLVSKMISINITSYIPYAHSFKLMGAKFGFLRDILARLTYKLCNSYITISDCFVLDLKRFNRQAICQVFENSIVLPNVILNRTSESDGIYKIFLIGRISFRQKGHDLLVKALQLIQKSDIDQDIEVHFVGDGPDFVNLKELCKNLPEFIRPVYHGWISECWTVANVADLVIIPSRYEGVPLVMLEAIGLGIPVLATNRDGMSDYLSRENLFELDPKEIYYLIIKNMKFKR